MRLFVDNQRVLLKGSIELVFLCIVSWPLAFNGTMVQVFGQIQSFVSNVAAISATLQRSHQHCKDCIDIAKNACDCMQLQQHRRDCKALCRRLSKFLKIHWEQEAGLKVCLKCFFTTTVNRFITIIFFAFLIKKK